MFLRTETSPPLSLYNHTTKHGSGGYINRIEQQATNFGRQSIVISMASSHKRIFDGFAEKRTDTSKSDEGPSEVWFISIRVWCGIEYVRN